MKTPIFVVPFLIFCTALPTLAHAGSRTEGRRSCSIRGGTYEYTSHDKLWRNTMMVAKSSDKTHIELIGTWRAARDADGSGVHGGRVEFVTSSCSARVALEGRGCELIVSIKRASVKVTQVGSCSDFGANVDLTGFYHEVQAKGRDTDQDTKLCKELQHLTKGRGGLPALALDPEQLNSFDLDEDGKADSIAVDCPGSPPWSQADPCVASISVGSGFNYEVKGWRVFVIRHKAQMLAVTSGHWQGGEPPHLLKIYRLGKAGAEEICNVRR